MNNKITIRSYVEADADFLAAIYFYTIHKINTKDYSPRAFIILLTSSSTEIESMVSVATSSNR
jgi:hypothetical protein